MNLRLNRNLFLQTGADSAELGMLATVVHRAGAAGDYAGTVYRADQEVGEFTLHVVDDEPAMGVQIDLAGQKLPGRRWTDASDDCGCPPGEGSGGGPRPIYRVSSKGYAVFHVSSGMGGYSVQLAGPRAAGLVEGHGEAGRSMVWSSRELQKGDLFAATLLRPGTYSIATQRGEQGKLRLMYPERGKTAYRPPEPIRVAVTEQGLEPAGYELQPLQGQVFEIHAPARITIALVEPDDREEHPPDRPRTLRYSVRRRPAGADAGPRDIDRPDA